MADQFGEVSSNQYDALLRVMDSGLLIGINNSAGPDAVALDECRVEWSSDDRAEVAVLTRDTTEYQIHRDRRDKLIYSEVSEAGLSYVDDVVTLEVLGFD